MPRFSGIATCSAHVHSALSQLLQATIVVRSVKGDKLFICSCGKPATWYFKRTDYSL